MGDVLYDAREPLGVVKPSSTQYTISLNSSLVSHEGLGLVDLGN